MVKLNFIFAIFLSLCRLTHHRILVFFYIIKILILLKPDNKYLLFKRAIFHDIDKFKWNAVKCFGENYFDLKKVEYNSPEYEKIISRIKPVIKKHHSTNKHHPEYFDNNYDGMSELDKLEMIADWISASKLQKNGNIFQSIEKNQNRFLYDDEEKRKLRTIVLKIL